MTPLQQRGYDDQRAGRLDTELMADPGPKGREYRDGTREARRDAFDAGELAAVVVCGATPSAPIERAAAVAQPVNELPKVEHEVEIKTTPSGLVAVADSKPILPMIIPPVREKKRRKTSPSENPNQSTLF